MKVDVVVEIPTESWIRLRCLELAVHAGNPESVVPTNEVLLKAESFWNFVINNNRSLAELKVIK